MSCLKCKENRTRFSKRVEGYHSFSDTTDYIFEGKILLIEKEGRVIYRECTTCQSIWVEQNSVTELEGDWYNGFEKVYTTVIARVVGEHEVAFIRKRAENQQ